jgi:hypothetical protein
MKTPKDYNGKVILKFATSPHGLLDDLVINLVDDQIEEVGYVETSDIIIHLYKLDDIIEQIKIKTATCDSNTALYRIEKMQQKGWNIIINYSTFVFKIRTNEEKEHCIICMDDLTAGDLEIKEKMDYKQRKKLGVQTCFEMVNTDFRFKEWETFFSKHNKKDDLSDCFLQGMWYIKYKI